MLKALRWITLCTMLLFVLFLGTSAVLFLFALEKEPRVSAGPPADYVTVADAKAFAKRIKIQFESADEKGATLAVTERELDQLSQLGAHTFKWLHTNVDLEGAAILTNASVQLPQNPFGRYLNLGAQIQQSNEGIFIDRLSMGPMSIPGGWLLPLGARLADIVLREQKASLLLSGISGVQVAGDTVLLSVTPPPDVKAHIKQAVRTLQDLRLPVGEQERVVHYYDLLVEEGVLHGGRDESLAAYLYPLMSSAAERSIGGSAIAENRAAIWALAIYFSNGAFELLIGKIVSSERELVRPPHDVTLAGRGDLMAHFLGSAAIMLATQEGISIAAGEFKELLDSGDGGSGFSFVDVAADRSGTQFATLATASETQAGQLQQELSANNSEVSFFPDTSGLLEGLSEEQFRQQYGDVQSERYRQQVADIDQRIAVLLIYRQPASL